MMNKKFVLIILSLLTFLPITNIFANGYFSPATQNLHEFNLRSEINAWGFAGSHLIGFGQGMVPIFGDDTQVLYALGEGKIARSDSGWSVGAGVGYRKITDDILFGGYTQLDFNRSPMENSFWVINPGIEALTLNWDFRINGYIPFSNKNWLSAQTDTVFASAIGNYNYVSFSGHDKFDRLIDVTTTTYEQVGMGLDGEIGRNIPFIKNLKAFVDGYYFKTSDLGSVSGCGARMTYQVNDYLGLEGRDTYDNLKKNTALIGIKLSLGGFSSAEKTQFGLSGRLLDPIEHNFATAGAGYVAPVKSELNVQSLMPHQQNTLVGDNFWFFKALGTENYLGDGTFENPYIGFEPAMVTNIVAVDPSGAVLYFAPGNYSLQNFVSHAPLDPTIITNGVFKVPSNFTLSGRTDDYKSPAIDDNRAIFAGGFDFYNVSNITLDSIQLQNYSTPLQSALRFHGTNNINFESVEIGVPGSGLKSYSIAADVSNTLNLNFNNSTLYAYYKGMTINTSSVNIYSSNKIDVVGLSGTVAGGIETLYSDLKILGNNNLISIDTFDIPIPFPLCFGIYSKSSNILIAGNYNSILCNAFSSPTGSSIFNIYLSDSNLTISGDYNKFTSATFNSNHYLDPYVLEVDFSSVKISGNYNEFTAQSENTDSTWVQSAFLNYANMEISGNNNTFLAEIKNSTTASWEINVFDFFVNQPSTITIGGNNNKFIANASNNPAATNFNSYCVFFDFSVNSFIVSGNGNTFNSDAKNAYGIYDNYTSPFIKITGSTVFNVGLNSNPAFAAGIFIAEGPSGFTTDNFIVKNTTFNIHAADENNAWGINFNGISGLDPNLLAALLNDNIFNGVYSDHRVQT